MALRTLQVTLGAAATPITTGANRLSIRQMFIFPTAHDAFIGTSTVDATHGIKVPTLATVPTVIGPFSGDTPTDTNEWNIFGTQNDVVQVLVVTS